MGAGMDGAAEAGLQRATHTLQQERRLRWGVSAAPALPLMAWEVMGGLWDPQAGDDTRRTPALRS